MLHRDTDLAGEHSNEPLGFIKTGNFLIELLLDSQEGLCSMELESSVSH
jgi:hypothetical protein